MLALPRFPHPVRCPGERLRAAARRVQAGVRVGPGASHARCAASLAHRPAARTGHCSRRAKCCVRARTARRYLCTSPGFAARISTTGSSGRAAAPPSRCRTDVASRRSRSARRFRGEHRFAAWTATSGTSRYGK